MQKPVDFSTAETDFFPVGGAEVADFTLGVSSPTDPDFASVIILSGFEGADASTTILDESPVPRILTAQNNAQIDTARAKFGVSSLLVNDTGDSVTAADDAALLLGTQHFTIEGFFRWTSDPSAFQMLAGKHQNASDQKGYVLYRGTSNKLGLYISENGSTSLLVCDGTFDPTLGQWYHICTDFDGTTYRVYVDGVVITSSTTLRTPFVNNVPFSIGAQADGIDEFIGHVDEFRLTIGVARYAGAFTPPTEAFPRS